MFGVAAADADDDDDYLLSVAGVSSPIVPLHRYLL
jgi:hypothetical protein